MSDTIFLIDANALITPYESYYPFDFAKTFWSQLEQHINEGNIALLDMVKDEILKGEDDLKTWTESLTPRLYIPRGQADILQKYSEVLTHVQTNPCYKTSALSEWSRDTVADAWLIATAAVKGFTIVTFETPNKGLNAQRPSKEAKIPDVADVFGVKTVNLFSMMRSLGIML